MIGRSEIFIKWALYGAAALLCALLQGFLLQQLRLFGVMPFLFPALAAIVAMYEGAFSGAVWALVLGICCDLALPAPLPCFYTLIFPLVGLCAGLLSRSWLSAGFVCALAVSAVAFGLTDGFHCVVLVLSGKGAWAAGALMALRETAATLVFLPLVFPLFRWIYRKCHRDD